MIYRQSGTHHTDTSLGTTPPKSQEPSEAVASMTAPASDLQPRNSWTTETFNQGSVCLFSFLLILRHIMANEVVP